MATRLRAASVADFHIVRVAYKATVSRRYETRCEFPCHKHNCDNYYAQIVPEDLCMTEDGGAIRIKWPDLPTTVEYTARWLYTHDSTRHYMLLFWRALIARYVQARNQTATSTNAA